MIIDEDKVSFVLMEEQVSSLSHSLMLLSLNRKTVSFIIHRIMFNLYLVMKFYMILILSIKQNIKIAYPYFEVEIIKHGEQFNDCYQKDTNQYLKIKNEFYIQEKIIHIV